MNLEAWGRKGGKRKGKKAPGGERANPGNKRRKIDPTHITGKSIKTY